jgi:SPW repeat
MNQWTNAKLCDVGNLILGAFLFLSPWIFKYPMGAEFWNAVAAGVIIAALSIATLAAFTVWEEWLNLIVGLWLIVSPWVLKFPDRSAMRVDVAVGIVVAALAAIELWTMWHEPQRRALNR